MKIGGRINAYKAMMYNLARARVYRPLDWTNIKGVIDITGTMWAKNFQYYRIMIGKGTTPNSWTEIINSTIPVNGTLASLDTTSLDDGLYKIRLQVVCDEGKVEDITRMIVNHESTDLIVDDDGGEEYVNIQDAIDNAGTRDTVYVRNGIYYLGVFIDRPLYLLGEDKTMTIIDYNYYHYRGINIVADGVHVSGFTIQNCGYGMKVHSDNNMIYDNIFSKNRYAIYLLNACNNYFADNVVEEGERSGIVLKYSDNNNITSNTIVNNDYSGLSLSHGSNNRFSDNTIIGGGDGIYLVYSFNNVICDNTIMTPGDDSIYLRNGFNNIIVRNTLEDHDYGIYLGNASLNEVSENTISVGRTGIRMYDLSNYNTLIGNTISGNTDHGIYLESSSDNNISLNTITNNIGDGIILASPSDRNIISQNVISYNNHGITVDYSDANILFANTITYNEEGIYQTGSVHNNYSRNIIVNNYGNGIRLIYGSYHTISGNDIRNNNGDGLYMWYSRFDVISKNNFENNTGFGINNTHYFSSHSVIYHNNFISNNNDYEQAYDEGSNTWDNGYPSGGNYWYDYTGDDNYHGPNQDQPGGDGIGDTPYPIPGDSNVDRYPLMDPVIIDYISPEITSVYHIPETVKSGSPVSIYAVVTDENSGVDTVEVHVTFPNQTTEIFTMEPYSGDTYVYVFTDTEQIGVYEYMIWAADNAGNTNTSTGHSFTVYEVVKVTYYFNSFDPMEAWEFYPEFMVDGNTETFAETILPGPNAVQRCDDNSFSGLTSLDRMIISVELRTIAYFEGIVRPAILVLRPVFRGILDGDNHIYVLPFSSEGWSPYFDITNDTNAPISWTWMDIDELDCDVEAFEGEGKFLCSIVQLRVTYLRGLSTEDISG